MKRGNVWAIARNLRWPAGVLVGLALTWLLVRDVDLRAVAGRLAAARLEWIAAALFMTGLSLAAKTARWRTLFPRDSGVRWLDLLGPLLVGQLVNTAIPVRVGEVARVSAITGFRPSRVYTMSTIVAEKLVDGAQLGVLAWLALALAPLPEAIRSSAIFVSAISMAILALWAGTVALRPHQRLLPSGLVPPIWMQKGLREAASAIRQLGDVKVLANLSGWSAVAYVAGIATNLACLQALSFDLPWSASLAVFVVVQFGGALPISPGRLGVFQGLCVAALAPYGANFESALSFGILLYGVVVVLPGLGGLGYLILLRRMETSSVVA